VVVKIKKIAPHTNFGGGAALSRPKRVPDISVMTVYLRLGYRLGRGYSRNWLGGHGHARLSDSATQRALSRAVDTNIARSLQGAKKGLGSCQEACQKNG